MFRQKNVTKQIFFFKSHAENEASRQVHDLLLFFKKALYDVKASGLQPSFNILIVLNLVCDKNILYKTLDNRSTDMLNFDILEKGLGIVPAPPFCICFFQRDMSHVIFY